MFFDAEKKFGPFNQIGVAASHELTQVPTFD
jgi:hypothetical protein